MSIVFNGALYIHGALGCSPKSPYIDPPRNSTSESFKSSPKNVIIFILVYIWYLLTVMDHLSLFLTQSLPIHRTNAHKRSFMVELARLWNSLPLGIRGLSSLGSFKVRLFKHLMSAQSSGWVGLSGFWCFLCAVNFSFLFKSIPWSFIYF